MKRTPPASASGQKETEGLVPISKTPASRPTRRTRVLTKLARKRQGHRGSSQQRTALLRVVGCPHLEHNVQIPVCSRQAGEPSESSGLRFRVRGFTKIAICAPPPRWRLSSDRMGPSLVSAVSARIQGGSTPNFRCATPRLSARRKLIVAECANPMHGRCVKT